jgi:hypothetical protein
MAPMISLRLALPRCFLACGLAFSLPAPVATAERSPIFGSAVVEAMSEAAARDITARGFWANTNGAVAVSFAYNAYIYAYYARYFAVSGSANEQAWYSTAAWYAYYAYVYASWAASNSASGI